MGKSTEKKKVVLTLCKVFPKTHSKAGELTGFEDKIKACHKIHTIRANKNGIWDKRYKDIAEGKKYLSLREWTGRPYNSVQREIARADKIGLQHITMTYGVEDAEPRAWVDDVEIDVCNLAIHDGLRMEDFTEWFFGNGNVFEGVIIHFTDFRY